MNARNPRRDRNVGRAAEHRPRGFTLIELLTVMFIIGLLISILIPALNSARNAAKKSASKAVFNAIRVGLDLFKTDNERDFRQTNGYPPSYAHPPIPGFSFDPYKGEFPFQPDKQATFPVYGAHWLPAMLMGADGQGYVKGSSVPKTGDLRTKPWLWYSKDALGPGQQLERMPMYLDPNGVRTLRTDELIGKPNLAYFPSWADDRGVRTLPVIVDAFDQPVLYYVANSNGRPSNMVAEDRNDKNEYVGPEQQNGPPYYFHEDNEGFTGGENGPGWDLGGGAHSIGIPGAELTADKLIDLSDKTTRWSFARFILDRKLERELLTRIEAGESVDPATPLRPSNPDSYLLISAGADGRYGGDFRLETTDDITNFPLAADE